MPPLGVAQNRSKMVTWQVHLSTSISKVHGLSAMYNLDLVLVSNLSRVVIFEYRMVLFP
jgi:hypothetical protein